MGSNLLNVAAFAGMMVSIRCPRCGTKLLWKALSTRLGLRWYFGFRSCPACDFTPTAVLGPESPVPLEKLAPTSPLHSGLGSDSRLGRRLALLAAVLVVSVFAVLIAPSMIAKRRARRAYELLSAGMPCGEAQEVVAALGTRESAARLGQTCKHVQLVKSPQPVVLQFNAFTGETFFFQAMVDADGTVDRPSRVGIR